MITLTEHLIMELKADTLKSAALKAQKIGDERAAKFMQAYLDKLKNEFDSSEASDETKTLNQWYKQDKQAFAKLKSTYGRNISDPRYRVKVRGIEVPKGMEVVSQMCFIGTFKDNDGDQVEVNVGAKWLEMDDDKYAFIRNEGKRIVILSIGAEWGGAGNPAYAYVIYNVDDDKVEFDSNFKTGVKSFDDLFGDSKEEGMKYVNQFLSCLNSSHKDI